MKTESTKEDTMTAKKKMKTHAAKKKKKWTGPLGPGCRKPKPKQRKSGK
jgi:hypothetical protein